MKLRRSVAVALLFLLVLAARPVSVAEGRPTLRVFAASSLTEVVEALARSYPDARVEPSFGGSSVLARQIRDGAPADVFLSASPEWMEFLREAQRLAGDPLPFARNRLVCIAARDGALARGGVSGPRALLEAIGPTGRVAIADEGVPAGEYARAALASAGLLDAFRGRLVGQRDVRAVLNAVESGSLAAGFVYATDARVASVAVLFPFDAASHPPIEYRAAVLRGAAHPAEARRFLDHLRDGAARALLADAGFSLPGSP